MLNSIKYFEEKCIDRFENEFIWELKKMVSEGKFTLSFISIPVDICK